MTLNWPQKSDIIIPVAKVIQIDAAEDKNFI